MVLSKKILILEDDLRTLSKLLAQLDSLEQDQPFSLSLVILTDYTQVEDYINSNPKAKFDVIILDRDCKLGGSFHVLDIERFGIDKIVAISSVPEYNEQLRLKGVDKIVQKDFMILDQFSDNVAKIVREMIRDIPVYKGEV